MSIDSESELAARGRDDPDLLLYDYFKHLTTMTLVTLGGVLSIAQGSQRVSNATLLLIVVLVSIGGGIALQGLDVIVRVKTARAPMPWTLKWYRLGATGCFALGLGSFLAVVTGAI